MAIGVLGSMQVDGDRPLEPRDRICLSVLTLHVARVVSPDRLADAMWGESPPPSWHKQVQICIGRLRRSLGAAAIVTMPGGYRLAVDPESIDSCRFEQLIERARALRAGAEADRAAATYARALALWRGPPLPELDGWPPARSEVTRLEELRRTVQEDLLDARLAAGDHRQVAVEAEALVAAEPLRERRWAVLALAQYRCGRQADALATLRKARELLADRLGIDPGRELGELEVGILRQDRRLDPVAEPTTVSDTCPYRGLAPYGVDDNESFFGRDADVTACLARLSTTSVLVIAGPSGCGKSSLARAGLVPALGRLGRPAVVIVPGQDPVTALADGLTAAQGAAVLVVDQFEEVFASDDVVGTFCQDLARYAQEQASVVITVRSDHVGRLGSEPAFSRLVEQGLFLVGPLSGAGLREAIEQPAALAGLRLESGLTDLLMRDVEGEAGGMPLLSHALVETWRRRDGHVLAVEGYRATGGIRGAVSRSADRLYDGLPLDQRAAVRSVMLRLVTTSVDGDPVRCRVATRSLVGEPGREQVVAMLVRSRLVIADEDTLEVAHEALARAWPRLRCWLDEDVAGQRILRHLSAAADGWDSLGSPDSELLRGARLETAQEWRAATSPDLTAVETLFLEASAARAESDAHALAARARRDARQNRRLRLLLMAGSACLALAVVAGLVALNGQQDLGVQRDAAVAAQDAARIEALVNRSLAVRSSDRAAAALLAVEAYRRQPDAGSRSALMGTFTAAPTFLGQRYLPGQQVTGALVPGTSTAIVNVDRAGLALIDLDTGAMDDRFQQRATGAGPTTVRVSADGSTVARLSWTTDVEGCAVTGAGRPRCGLVAVFDVGTGRPVMDPLRTPFTPSDLALNADGSLVAVAGGDSGAAVWHRTADGSRVGDLPGVAADGAGGTPTRFDGEPDSAAVVFGAEGTLYVGSSTGPLRAVDPATAKVLRSVDVPRRSAESHLLTTADGLLLTGGTDRLALVDTRSMTVRWSVSTDAGVHPETCPWLAVAPRASRLYCGSYYGVVAERDLATGLPTGETLDPQRGSVGQMTISANGGELVAFGAEAPVISRWRLDGSGLITSLVARGHVVFDGYDPTGKTILAAPRPAGATIDFDFDRFAIWDPTRDRSVGAVDDVLGLGWVGAGSLTGYSPQRGSHQYYDPVGKPVSGDHVPLAVDRMWPSAGGLRAYAGLPDGEVWAIDAATRQRVGPSIETGGYPAWVSATRDGERVVATSYGSAAPQTAVYDGRTGEELARGLDGTTISSVSLDGVLVGVADRQITRYDLDTLEPVATIGAARGEVNSLQFSRDSSTVMATSNDQTVSLYDVASGTLLGDPIPSVAPLIIPGFLRPDGQAVAVTAREGVAIWDLDPDHHVEAACRMAGRNLTRTEWTTYLDDLGRYRATCDFDSLPWAAPLASDR